MGRWIYQGRNTSEQTQYFVYRLGLGNGAVHHVVPNSLLHLDPFDHVILVNVVGVSVACSQQRGCNEQRHCYEGASDTGNYQIPAEVRENPTQLSTPSAYGIFLRNPEYGCGNSLHTRSGYDKQDLGCR